MVEMMRVEQHHRSSEGLMWVWRLGGRAEMISGCKGQRPEPRYAAGRRCTARLLPLHIRVGGTARAETMTLAVLLCCNVSIVRPGYFGKPWRRCERLIRCTAGARGAVSG